MSLSTLKKGQRIKVRTSEFLILQKLPDSRWQLQNCATGEWSALSGDDLLDGFAQGDVSFIVDAQARADGLPTKVTRDLSERRLASNPADHERLPIRGRGYQRCDAVEVECRRPHADVLDLFRAAEQFKHV